MQEKSNIDIAPTEENEHLSQITQYYSPEFINL